MTLLVRHSDDVASRPVDGGLKTTLQLLLSSGDGAEFAVRRFVIQRGGSMPRHTNTVEHEQYILHGRAAIGIGMDVYSVREGDVVFIPEGAPHWYVNNGDEDFEFLCVIPNKKDELRIVEDSANC